MNWWYGNNGVRIALTGGHLSEENIDDHNTQGLGCHFYTNGKKGISLFDSDRIEISNIQNCPFPSCPLGDFKVQGKDHGWKYNSGPVYGNYAIYLANKTMKFPTDQKLTSIMKSKNLIKLSTFLRFSLSLKQ